MERIDAEKILVVEDEPILLELIKEILEIEGLRVDVAANASEALELLKENKYAIVMTDINMPGMDGMKMCELAKSRPEIYGEPGYWIALTAYLPGELQEAVLENFQESFFKPIKLPVLAKVLKDRLMGIRKVS